MKICAIICEFNPFHNGHQYLLSEAKKRTNADALLCIMSGNFVQRGEIAILDKYTRAKHAVECGADIVIELPTVFATSNAEIFASGAISILSKFPSVTHLAFGAEYADKTAFLETAKGLINEPGKRFTSPTVETHALKRWRLLSKTIIVLSVSVRVAPNSSNSFCKFVSK